MVGLWSMTQWCFCCNRPVLFFSINDINVMMSMYISDLIFVWSVRNLFGTIVEYSVSVFFWQFRCDLWEEAVYGIPGSCHRVDNRHPVFNWDSFLEGTGYGHLFHPSPFSKKGLRWMFPLTRSLKSWDLLRWQFERFGGSAVDIEMMLGCVNKNPEINKGVSENRGTPKSSILIGFSIINHPFWGTTIYGNTHKFSESLHFEGHLFPFIIIRKTVQTSTLWTCWLYVGTLIKPYQLWHLWVLKIKVTSLQLCHVKSPFCVDFSHRSYAKFSLSPGLHTRLGPWN